MARTTGKAISTKSEIVTSLAKSRGVALGTPTKVAVKVRAKKLDPTLPKKKQPRIDQTVGQEIRKSVGDIVNKVRRIDREANTYSEIVTDESGDVIHQQHEPLSEHRGHGSDKK